MDAQLLYFADYQEPAQRLAKLLDISCLPINCHRFPDGESRIQLPATSSDHLIIYRSLDRPNDKLIEILLACETARQQGANQLSLIAPYLCYMRQDKAFSPGEAVSQKVIGSFLAQLFDNVITVDPHLHRIHQLSTAIPCKQAISLSATELMGEFLIEKNLPYTLIGPDEESQQWVQTIAHKGNFTYAIAHKTRHSDKKVDIQLPELQIKGTNVVLVDDMISTGHTMAETAKKLLDMGALSVNCLITHALFDDKTNQLLRSSGISQIWSTDSIIHPSNIIHLDSLLASSILAL
ncbi:MAG: ribose-phosphate diphosphokinase [Gammaproteobacteria bacterium]|nr:ribose-phosphate diphosphokinase [Gammaproteobacteria bacterium]